MVIRSHVTIGRESRGEINRRFSVVTSVVVNLVTSQPETGHRVSSLTIVGRNETDRQGRNQTPQQLCLLWVETTQIRLQVLPITGYQQMLFILPV